MFVVPIRHAFYIRVGLFFSALLFTESYSGMLGIGACLGFAKGLRSVYMPLVIPDYIKSVERLASAASIQSLVNGCFLLSAGPLIGTISKFFLKLKKLVNLVQLRIFYPNDDMLTNNVNLFFYLLAIFIKT